MIRRRLAFLCALALAATSCTRSRPVPTTGSHATVVPGAVTIEDPTDGTTVSSPITVRGTAEVGPGLALAVQVRRRDPDGGLRWLANQSLSVDGDGRFAGTLPYALEAPSPGIVEVIVVNPAGGVVVTERSVDVTLAASP